MTALVGGLFILAGFLGGAFCICKEYGLRIMYLKKMQSVYEYMKYEISYGKVPIPQMLFHIAEMRCSMPSPTRGSPRTTTPGRLPPFAGRYIPVFARAAEIPFAKGACP